MKKIFMFLTLLVVVFLLSACDPKEQKINDVKFENVPTSMTVGEEIKITYTSQDGVSAEWSSNDQEVATVVDGKISAVKVGTVTIKVLFTLGELTKEYSFDITINEPGEEQYSISYENDGQYKNGEGNPTSYKVNELPLTLLVPSKDGYVFLGWYLNDELVTEIIEGTTGNITLVAKWEEVRVAPLLINYKLDGGVLPSNAPTTFFPGTVVVLPTPSKEGYTFLGWYINNKLVTEISVDQNEEVTVSAKWEKEKVYGEISYIINGGKLPEQVVEMYEEGVGVELPIPSKDGNKFLGWTLEENSSNYITAISKTQKGAVTVYAHWEETNNFTITYKYDEGQLPSKPATTFEEMESAFWPAFQEWSKDTGDLASFKSKVLGKWKGNADGGYRLYLPGGEGMQDENYFVNDPEVDKVWYEWFLAIESQIKDINGTQSAWSSTYVGYMRIYQLFTGNTGLWNDERRAVVYNACLCSTPLVTEYTFGEEKDLVNLVISDGREFLGWYDEDGKKVEKITSDMRRELILTAMWSASTPATSFDLQMIDRLGKLEEYALTWVLLPADTTNKTIVFTSSDESILSIDKYAVMYAHKEGKVTVTYNVLANPDLSGTFEVEVYVNPYIDATYETTSVVTVGETIKINAEIKSGKGNVVFTSSDNLVATVDQNGKVTGVSSGYTEITVSKENDNEVSLTLGVTVLSKDEAKLYSVIANAHNAEVYYVPLLNVAYDYDTSVICSVSDLLFNWEYKVDNKWYVEPNRPKMSSIEFITVHYSGMPKAHQDGEIIAQAMYNGFHGSDWGGTSWHYSTGNDGIFYSMDDTKVAWHAGDGTGTAFKWINTGVKATSNTKPTFAVVPNSSVKTGYSYSVNGTTTNVEAPGNYRLTFYGPTWKIEDGYYYMGNTYYSSSYNYISSRGGNLNSIGIETACNYGSDLWYTYHVTAQLVSRLLVKNNLDITRVQGHHTFSGKDCPQTLLEGEGELWYKFIDLVEAELALYKTMSDYTITCVSSNKELVSDNGRVLKVPNYTETVTYTLTIKNNKTGVEKEMKLSSIIHGQYTL